jgi:cell division protein YceG involved in septum cleavage
MEDLLSPAPKKNYSLLYGILGIAFFYLLLQFFVFPPTDFPVKTIVKIEPGMSLRSISSLLLKDHVIRSRIAFEAFAIALGGEKHIISADYYFEKSLSAFSVAYRIVKGDHHLAPVVVTIPEGFDNSEIADTAGAL